MHEFPRVLTVRVKAVVADVLGAVFLAFPRRQHFGFQWRRRLWNRRGRWRNPPPLGLLKNPRVARIDRLNWRRGFYPAGLGQVLGFGFVGAAERRPFWRDGVSILQAGYQVTGGCGSGTHGVGRPARQHGAGLAAVLRRGAGAPPRRLSVVPQGSVGASRPGQGQSFHPGSCVRQKGGRVTGEIGRGGGVVRRGGEVQSVVGRGDKPSLRGGHRGVLGLLRGEQAVTKWDAAVRARSASDARVKAGLGIRADKLVLEERTSHGISGAGHDLRARRVTRGRRQPIDVATRVDTGERRWTNTLNGACTHDRP